VKAGSAGNQAQGVAWDATKCGIKYDDLSSRGSTKI